jgi:amidohydrolase
MPNKPLAALTAVFFALAPLAARAADIGSVLPVARDAYGFLHRNPELGKAETKAHDYLTGQLRGFGGFTFVASKNAPTAVIAVFDTGRPGPTIALRAEMDARRLDPGATEPASHSPRSEIDGVMHNCGHDVHAAILLATAKYVATHKARYAGKIVFLFQPAEEVAGGADDIVAEGVLDKLGVKTLYALHSAPGMPVGAIAVSPGAMLAGSNYFTLKLTGRGSHAAAPHDGDDLPVVAADFVEALARLPARQLDIANRPVVISVTKVVAESGGPNILPASAELSGTIRAFEPLTVAPEGGEAIETIIRRTIDGLAAAHGVRAEWSLRVGSPATVNDPSLYADTLPALQAAWPGRIDTRPSRGMFSEDFAYYTADRPAFYVSLGVAKGGLGEGGVHTADFTIHPDALEAGVRLMTTLAEIGTTGKAER